VWLARGYPLGRLHWRDPGVGFARSCCRSVCLDTLLPAASEKDAALGRWLARELPAPGSGDRAWLPRRFRDWRRGAYALAHPPPTRLAWPGPGGVWGAGVRAERARSSGQIWPCLRQDMRCSESFFLTPVLSVLGRNLPSTTDWRP